MHNILIIIMGYMLLREYISDISLFSIVALDVLFLSILVFIHNEMRREYSKLPWILAVGSLVLFWIYKSISVFWKMSINERYILMIEQLTVFLIVLATYLKDTAKTLYFFNPSLSTSKLDKLEKKNEAIEIVEEKSTGEEEIKESDEIKKIPVIVITRD